MAIGTTGAVQPGQIVPANTEFVFEINLCDPATRAYFQRSLDQGRLNLLITSLHPTAGPGSTQYPVFYTKENPLSTAFGYAAKLELVVNQGLRSDIDNDGSRTVNDFVTFLNLFAAGNPAADADDNCLFNVNDFVTFLNLFAAGR
jgi:hypothetical protein